MEEKILVVDDEESIRFSFHLFLSEEGYEVNMAATYGQAMQLVENNEYDLVFIDIILEYKTGIDLLKAVRHLWPNTPVIMITGAPSVETATESLRMGALDYIVKPIRQETLLRVTTVALKHRLLTSEKESCRLNFEALFRSVKDGIITVNQMEQITAINDAATSICSVQREKVLYQFLPAMGHNCDGKCLNAIQEVLAKKEALEIRYIECRKAENPKQVISLTVCPMLGLRGQPNGAVMVIRDQTRLQELERSLEVLQDLDRIIGEHETIKKVKTLIQELTDIHTTVLITGESGTGKELVVDALHRNGKWKNTPLVKVNCASLSETLLESELFGHVKGAFTGAIRDKMGLFERAHGGTIFLDEIGEISLHMQLRLLRVIESGTFKRVGDSKTMQVDIRVVAATNQDLKQKVAAGEFREDLYYRLKVVEIQTPALRDRRSDIPLLIDHLLTKFNRIFTRNIAGLSTDAFKAIMHHNWPGNVRELENTIEHAFVRCHQSIITVQHLPSEFSEIAQQLIADDNPAYEQQEAQRIRNMLTVTSWNKSRAAELLGMSRRTIYRKIDQYNITPID